MKSLLATLLLVCSLPVFAQRGDRHIQVFMDNTNVFPLSKIMAVREKLIRKYVLGTHQIAAVSACGEEDLLGAEENYVCVYAYRDTAPKLMQELFDGETNGRIDGVRIVVQIVSRKK